VNGRSLIKRKLSAISIQLSAKAKGAKMKDFRQLKVWDKAHQLTLAIYKTTKTFPTEERYGLTSQLRRASSSIPANIAEGCCRGGDRELAQFLQIAMSSAGEVEYHLLLAHHLKYFDKQNYNQLNSNITEVKQMLSSFIKKLRKPKS